MSSGCPAGSNQETTSIDYGGLRDGISRISGKRKDLRSRETERDGEKQGERSQHRDADSDRETVLSKFDRKDYELVHIQYQHHY